MLRMSAPLLCTCSATSRMQRCATQLTNVHLACSTNGICSSHHHYCSALHDEALHAERNYKTFAVKIKACACQRSMTSVCNLNKRALSAEPALIPYGAE
eukprot:21105-Heterococcus_DN1.PRE.3